jgi:transposase InsO family protein
LEGLQVKLLRSTQPYLRVTGWGWYYLSSVLDDYSRYIVAWKLCKGMSSTDVEELLDLAVEETGVDRPHVRHRPRLLSDNGPCYVSRQLREYLEEREIPHTRGAPYHPMTQGKIERFHRSLKNVISLQNHYLPGSLEQEIATFIYYYNHQRVHESLDNLTPADVYQGRAREILTARERVKAQTLRTRRRYNLDKPVEKKEVIRPDALREVSIGRRPDECQMF